MGEQSAAVVVDSDLAAGSPVGTEQRPPQFATLGGVGGECFPAAVEAAAVPDVSGDGAVPRLQCDGHDAADRYGLSAGQRP
ncbi:hypothetical protein [Nocardia abscessus]|uniref:hypothetical protein n=1 Tax=Nocardia abscessus TaxID=120957 RepID=UPI0024562009|nr:hypothetical protein [Nocardia abscessus]